MSQYQDTRVLARTGARSVTDKELTAVNGGFNSFHTFVCTVSLQPPYVKDGDAC